jgi:hypothetical protein
MLPLSIHPSVSDCPTLFGLKSIIETFINNIINNNNVGRDPPV